MRSTYLYLFLILGVCTSCPRNKCGDLAPFGGLSFKLVNSSNENLVGVAYKLDSIKLIGLNPQFVRLNNYFDANHGTVFILTFDYLPSQVSNPIELNLYLNQVNTDIIKLEYKILENKCGNTINFQKILFNENEVSLSKSIINFVK